MDQPVVTTVNLQFRGTANMTLPEEGPVIVLGISIDLDKDGPTLNIDLQTNITPTSDAEEAARAVGDMLHGISHSLLSGAAIDLGSFTEPDTTAAPDTSRGYL